MQTSNKILLGLVALVFITPLLLCMTLKRKIKAGDYYVVEDMGLFQSEKRKALKQPRLLILKGGPGYAQCQIIQDAKAGYQYDYGNGEDFQVQETGDTLIITFPSASKADINSYSRRIDLFLPLLPEVQAEGTAITLLATKPAIVEDWKVILSKGSALNIGDEKEYRDTVTSHQVTLGDQLEGKEYRRSAADQQFGHISITANGGQVFLGHQTRIRQLDLNLSNKASLKIPSTVVIEELAGAADTTTIIQASGKLLPQLSKIIK